MNKLMYILVFVLVIFPASVGAVEVIQITNSGGGGIKNITSASATGGDASVEVNTRNVMDGLGNIEVKVETEINGVRETKEIKKSIFDGGVVEINISTSTKDVRKPKEPTEVLATTTGKTASKFSNIWRNLLITLKSFWLFK